MKSDELALGRQPRLAAEPGVERLGQVDRSVGLLAVLQDRDQAAADGEAGAVQRVDEIGLAAGRGR